MIFLAADIQDEKVSTGRLFGLLDKKDEIHTNREFISTELHLIDSMYDNNYRLWDWRVEQFLRYYENNDI